MNFVLASHVHQEKVLVGAFSVIVNLQSSRRFVSSSSDGGDLQLARPLLWLLWRCGVAQLGSGGATVHSGDCCSTREAPITPAALQHCSTPGLCCLSFFHKT